MTVTDLRRRLELHGFGLLETIDPDTTGRWFLIQGYHRPLTAEEVEVFVTDAEEHWLSGDP